MGVDIAPRTDDDVLCTSGQIKITCSEVGEVARIQPPVMEQQAILIRVTEVTAGSRWSFEFQVAFHPLPHFTARGINNFDLVAGKWRAAGHEA